MRLLLSKDSKRELKTFLMEKYKCDSLEKLSFNLKVPLRTFQEWVYNKERYLPEAIIPKNFISKLKVLDKKEENWGRVKGGKKTYKIIIQKYGLEEIRRRQSHGGKKSKTFSEEPMIVNIKEPLFLEFYGILLGDGWIGKYYYKNKVINLIGISGHLKLDKDFFLYCRKNIKKLFNRKAYFKIRPNNNSIEINFANKMLLKYLNNELMFPLGKKVDLEINKKILDLGFNSLRHVIRGIFDTDGCFYLDKTPAGHPYPCISIEMKSPKLIKQINDVLKKEGFRVIYKENNKEGKSRITLKGNRQLTKWMNEISSSNPKHLNKIKARVVQRIRMRPS